MEKENRVVKCPFCLTDVMVNLVDGKGSKKCKNCKQQVRMHFDGEKIIYDGIERETIERKWLLKQLNYFLKKSWEGRQRKNEMELPIKDICRKIFGEEYISLGKVKYEASNKQLKILIDEITNIYKNKGIYDEVLRYKKFKVVYAKLAPDGQMIE